MEQPPRETDGLVTILWVVIVFMFWAIPLVIFGGQTLGCW